MQSFKVVSLGVIELEGYTWIQSEDFPPGCKESITVRGTTYFKTKKSK